MSKKNPSHSKDFQSLDEWLCYLETIHSTEIDLGLSRISQVAERLSIDLSFATVITVAGTNGKGTTCAYLENAFLHPRLSSQLSDKTIAHNQAPLKQRQNTDAVSINSQVAVYSSPHIKAFNERLRIDKEDVEDALLIEAFEKIETLRAEISLSYYEYTTLAALLVLMKLKPAVIILEVGLGGRLDATNIIDADVAVITTIDLDHQAFLGNDRETIGFEKAGIMRPNQLIVVGDTNAPTSVINHAKKMLAQSDSDSLKHASLSIRNQHFTVSELENSQWQWRSSEQLLSGLLPCFIPQDNVATALTVLSQLGLRLDSPLVNELIGLTKVAGRTEFFYPEHKEEQSQYPLNCDVMLDVGHNPQAARYLAKQLQAFKVQNGYKKVHAVVAMLVDKDIDNSLQALKEDVSSWYIGQLPVPRASLASEVFEKLQPHTKSINCFDNVTQAFKIANQNASSNDLILVFGSFFTVAEVRDLIS